MLKKKALKRIRIPDFFYWMIPILSILVSVEYYQTLELAIMIMGGWGIFFQIISTIVLMYGCGIMLIRAKHHFCHTM